MSGGFGAGFSQGFGQSLQSGMRFVAEQKQRGEELKLRRALADAQLKEHEAKLGLVQRQAQGVSALFQRLTQPVMGEVQQDPTGEEPLQQGRVAPPPLSAHERLAFALQIDPQAAVKRILDPNQGEVSFDPSKGLGRYNTATGQGRTVVPPQRPPVPAEVQALLGGTPAGGAQAPTQTAPVTQGGASGGAPQPTAQAPAGSPAAGAPGPQTTFLRSVTYDPTSGEWKLTLNEKQGTFQVSHQTVMGQNGQAQIIERVFDPTSGHVVAAYPIGVPVPAESIQRLTLAAQAMGLTPGTPVYMRMVAQLAKAQLLPPDAQAQAIAALEREAAALPSYIKAGSLPTTAALSGPATTAGAAIQAAQQQNISEAAAKADATARATAKADREEKPLQADDRKRYEALLSVDRVGGDVEKKFRPEFVGKGFDAAAFKKEWAQQAGLASQGKYDGGIMQGNIAASLREFTGKASREEIAFRRGLLDLQDQLLRARSGAAITEGEFQRLAKMVGSLWDEPGVFHTSLRRFRAEVKATLKDIEDVSQSSPGMLQKRRLGGEGATAPAGAPKSFRWER